MSISDTCCLHDLLARRFRVGKGNVLSHSSAEQEGILRNDADLTTQGIKLDLSDVVAIDQDPAFSRFIEPGKQFHKGAFTTTALAHDAYKGA